MEAEVNTAQAPGEEKPGTGEAVVEQPVTPEEAADAVPVEKRQGDAPFAVTGDLRGARGGALRFLLLVTGLALMGWLLRGLLALLGYRHRATLTLDPRGGLDVSGERRFMGLAVGATRRHVPRAAIELVDLVGRSGLWALASAAAALAVAGAMGSALFFWGVAGREPSWILAGLLVIGAGVLLDAVAYLWARRAAGRGRASLEIRTRSARMGLRGVEEQAARRLIERMARGSE